MPAILIPILAWFSRVFLVRLLLALGIYAGSSAILGEIFDAINDQLQTATGSLSGVFADAFAMSGLQQAITVVMAAYATALSIKAVKQAAMHVPGAGGQP